MSGIHRWPVNSPHKRPVTQKMLYHSIRIKGWIGNCGLFHLYEETYILAMVNTLFYVLEDLRRKTPVSEFILWMRPANERRCYIVTSSPIGWVHSLSDPYCVSTNNHRLYYVLCCVDWTRQICIKWLAGINGASQRMYKNAFYFGFTWTEVKKHTTPTKFKSCW